MRKNGYTLIELLVALSIFAIVMLAATAAYLSFIAYNRQAQTTANIMNTLSFAIDSMARNIRTGTEYDLAGSSPPDFLFVDAHGCGVEYTTIDPDTGTACSGDACSIVRSVDTSVSGCDTSAESSETNAPITDASVTVTNLNFVLTGGSESDSLQPLLTIVVDGYACVPNTDCTNAGRIPFDIETSASERFPDI